MTELRWRVSSRSSDQGSCVEVAWPGIVHIRDSKHRQGSRLNFSGAAMRAFADYAKSYAESDES